MKPEWVDEKYTCDCCGEDGEGKYFFIQMRGWQPMTLCEDCMDNFAVYNE